MIHCQFAGRKFAAAMMADAGGALAFPPLAGAQLMCLLPFAVAFFTKYFSWSYLAAGFLYAMVGLGTVNIVWLHRYGTHRAFTFRHPIYRFIIRNLTIRIVPEEAYIPSHHVHHAFTEQPGDPYNAYGGRLYCLLAGELHQGIAQNLTPADYEKVVSMVKHTGVPISSMRA